MAQDGFIRVDGWALPDLLAGQADLNEVFFPVDSRHRDRRNQHLSICEPCTGLDDQVTHGPAMIVEINVADCPDFPVGCLEIQPNQLLQSVNHGLLQLFGSALATLRDSITAFVRFVGTLTHPSGGGFWQGLPLKNSSVSANHSFAFLSRKALIIIDTELKLMAAPAITGLSPGRLDLRLYDVEAEYELRYGHGGGCEDPRFTFVAPINRYVMTCYPLTELVLNPPEGSDPCWVAAESRRKLARIRVAVSACCRARKAR